MSHKLVLYVRHLAGEQLTEGQVEEVLFALSSLPVPDSGWDLDRWWEAVVRLRRRRVKEDLVEIYGESCEACGKRPATDLHEVFVTRGDDTSWRQIFNFAVDNCALVCRQCHEDGVVCSSAFQERIRARRAWQGTSGSGAAR